MILHPTIVIGLGSTGKHVVANAQKYLYEVLNGDQLKLFRFIVLETAVNQHDSGGIAAGVHTQPVDIKVPDIGQAYFTLKQDLLRVDLGDDIQWCPSDMHINGPGAGNKRAGGRLMLVCNMDKVERIVQEAINDVREAALDDGTVRNINDLLEERGGHRQEQRIPTEPAFMVVGTLTGGTCSGACVDLGFLLRRIAPSSTREGTFFLPDRDAIPTYKANTWAALSDLAYFTDHPQDYRVVWDPNRNPQVYDESTDPAAKQPYNHIYLVSQRDQTANVHLPYRNDPSSPLLMMEGLCVAANLLGMYDLRQIRLSDLNTRVPPQPIYHTFLTHSMRGVSYPKYEISEAAACRIIADRICGYWLNENYCWSHGRSEELQQEEIRKGGRNFWNAKSQEMLKGLESTLDLREEARRIRAGQIPDVDKYLAAQLTQNRENTLYRDISQNVEGRRRALQETIREEFFRVLSERQNLQYGVSFLQGVQEEINATRRYWENLKTPTNENDTASWQQAAARMSRQLVDRYKEFSVNMLGQRTYAIQDQLEYLVIRLEMFLMHRTLGYISDWVDSELLLTSRNVRELLGNVQTYASTRASSILRSLQEGGGPLLRLSRASEGGFEGEIRTLAQHLPEVPSQEFLDNAGGNFVKRLLVMGQEGSRERDRLFAELVERIQPRLIKELQKGGAIDIVREIEGRSVASQAIQRAHETQSLSLPVRERFMTGADNVPSFLLTKSNQSSTLLSDFLSAKDVAFPPLQPQELPFFDHMAIFYQEGGKFNLDSLSLGEDMKRAYLEARRADEAVLEPLRFLKKHLPRDSAPASEAEIPVAQRAVEEGTK